jgi:iron complex transport system substrate-binding protein
VVPVGIRDWYGEQPNAVWPWAQDALGDATPQVLPANALNFEQIAALNPDLIIGISSGMTEQEYATLAAIAPTIAQSDAYIDYGVPWQEQTRVVGAALGRGEQAEALVAQVEGLFASARAQNPAFAGASAVVAVNFNNAYSAYGPQDVRGRLLTSLGFAIPQEIVERAGDSFFTSISNERLDLIDTDVLVIAVSSEAERAVIENDPLFQQLNAAQQGRVVFLDKELSGAASFSSVLSLPYLLERFVPALAAAIDGERAESAMTRTITHAMGIAEVPAVPQRVVVLDTSEVDNALALGAAIVGAPVAEVLEYQGYLAAQLDGITDTGTISEPNLEAILALKPDLILGSKQRYEAIYPQLSAIAPTVFVESLRVPWQQNFQLHAEALGKTAEAEVLLTAYNQRVAELQAILGPERAATTISVIRFRPGQVRLYLKSSFIGYILQDVGLGRPSSQDQDTFAADITLEQIADVDADYLFITGYAQNDSELDTFLNSPLWQTLGAVQNGRAIDVDDDHWIAGLGVQAATLVLDDLERFVMP